MSESMNENTARELVLVRAIETVDQSHAILSLDDRRYASRSGRELAQWQASEQGMAPTAVQFLQQRASLLLKRITQRTPAFGALARGPHLLQLMLTLLPVAALLLGVLLDRITDPHRVDLLSAPLLLIVLWNLAVYAAMLLWRWVDVTPARAPSVAIPLVRRAIAAFTARLAGGSASPRGKMPATLRSAVLAFLHDWTKLGAPLATARITRAVHLGAAMFAAGAVLSLYARGLLAQYGAGWESTFLDAQQVQSILSLVFAPARFVFQLPAFTVAEVAALRFAPASLTAAPSLVAAGARWVHLYAATLLLLVILPPYYLAFVIGVWLFYVQHQFEDAYWEQHKDWDYATAAITGSSYLRLPTILRWFTGNIGLHHVHHLGPRIPNYRLQRAHDENEIFHTAPVLTMREGVSALRLSLWDEARQRLIRFRDLRARHHRRP